MFELLEKPKLFLAFVGLVSIAVIFAKWAESWEKVEAMKAGYEQETSEPGVTGYRHVLWKKKQ